MPQVDTLLNELEARFEAMSTDVLGRRAWFPLSFRSTADLQRHAVGSLSTRIDSLESSIADIMSGTAGGPLLGESERNGAV
mgnify:FL=1